MSQTQTVVSTSVGLPRASLQGDSSAISDHAQIELEELGRRDSAKSIRISTGPTTPLSEPLSRAEAWKGPVQFATLCWTLFLAGWNDGTTGPLLDRIREVYHANFAIVSLIFVLNTVVSVEVADNCHLLILAGIRLRSTFECVSDRQVWIRKGSIAQVAGYAINCGAPPFPVFVFAYALNGFGIALQDAGANGYVAAFKKGAATKMGILHAIYGAGAFVAPLVATQFAQLPRWSFHFLTSLGISISNTALLIAVFRFKTQEQCLADAGQPADTTVLDQGNKMKHIFKMKEVHLLATFILAYIGVEVTLGGWIVTYIKEVRGGGPDSGYISSGFFGGLALGRVALLWLNKLVGERRIVFAYILMAIVLELIVWLVPSLIGGGVAISFVGFVLGPIYPIVMNHAARILPPWILTGSIGWIAGFGQAGSAFIPFITGAIASSKGIGSLQPLLVSLSSAMLVIWFIVPSSPRKVD
ncbi:hypothetical protein QCA50_012510 [Cerrena zonata]|uniref:Major facilitator superfamily (MFS) profile domain-containing protein n=1 Tax=Cerrena zonata TaxID=2478898 RepID=A0AAW0FSD0_9APHY